MDTAHMRALARRGGQVIARRRRGDAAWGSALFHRRGWKAMAEAYPSLLPRWAENAWRTRWGYPLLEVPSVALIKAPKRSKSVVTVQRGNAKDAGA